LIAWATRKAQLIFCGIADRLNVVEIRNPNG
jgi:hypothetical protein